MRSWSRLASALPCPAGRSVPGRGGPERRRRPRPDGTGRPRSVLGPHHVGNPGFPAGTSGSPTGRLNPQVNGPLRRRPGTPEEADGGFEPLLRHLQPPQMNRRCDAGPTVVLDKVRRYWEYAGADVDRAHRFYHDDAVLEFPQSGERFEGVASFTEWRRQYPAEVRYRVRRVTAREDLAVVEVSASYNGGPWQYGVRIARVPRRQGGARADLRHRRLGGARVAGPLALGHARKPAGVRH